MLTLPCVYMLETALYCRFKTELVQGRDVHQYETRSRDNFRRVQHRTVAFDRLPAQVGVGLLNKLPEDVKSAMNLNVFKTRLRRLLVSKVFIQLASSWRAAGNRKSTHAHDTGVKYECTVSVNYVGMCGSVSELE